MDAKRRCKECRMQVPPSMDVCMNCGRKLQAPGRIPSLIRSPVPARVPPARLSARGSGAPAA